MSNARYVWHPDLHWHTGERLFFVRLYFEPIYPEVREALEESLEKLDIASFHVYELVGSYDLMLRVWFAGNIRDLMSALKLPEVRSSDYMEVRQIHEHWVLAEGDSHAEPTLEDLTPELVERLNREMHEDSGADLSRYVRAGIIAPIRSQEGVKFFVSVLASIGTSTSIDFNDVLLEDVSQILEEADDLVTGRSIYAGDGFGRMLVMGRFPSERYFDFMDRVVLQLNNRHMRMLFSARTLTAFGATKDPFMGRDMLDASKVAAAVGRPPRELTRAHDEASEEVDVLLERGEGQHLEVKASAFLNFDRLVHQANPSWSELRPELVKAVCGLLNQRDRRRSTLIIGAVESDRYRRWLDEYKEDLAEIGSFTILGLEEDNPSGDWDLYQRRLADSLASAIDPSPLPFMTISLEQHTKGDLRKKVLRIVLTPTGKPFYESETGKLWVRQGAQAKDLKGREHDEFVQSMGEPT